jgi:hypothetical protein
VNRAKGAEAALELAHIRKPQRSEIENGAGTFRNDIDACATFNDIGIDGYAAAVIIPLFDARELLGNLMNGIDPFLGRQACVRSAAMHNQFGLANALTRCL